jgi:hypothetical protein
MGKLVLILLFLLLLSRRSDGTAGAHATVNVLLLFLGWFQDLQERRQVRDRRLWFGGIGKTHLEGAEQTLVYAHHCTRIVEFTAVVGCTE